MFKLVRVLENVQLKGAKGWMNEGVRGKEESNDIQQCILKNEKKKYPVQTSSNEICLFKTYIEMI